MKIIKECGHNMKRKNPYKYITDAEYKRFMGTTAGDYIFTAVIAALTCVILTTISGL